MIPIQPQYVQTILMHFDADTVDMPKGKWGYKYIVDLADNLTGWVEAKAIWKITSEAIAQFIFEVMCRYGCIFQLMVRLVNQLYQVLMDGFFLTIYGA